MKPLTENLVEELHKQTEICTFITQYENAVWDYLSDVFRFHLRAAEIGFTDDLIYRIIQFYSGRHTNCEVYAFNDNVHEKMRGADIDLFIEYNGTGFYHFFMIQAKIMDCNGRFRDIKRWNALAQYYNLIRNAKKESALPLYLLYNGSTLNSNIVGVNWGLSIVEASYIRNLRFSQRRASAPTVTFNQLHPLNMKPFHVLFCDLPNDFTLLETINGISIYKGYPYINKIKSIPGCIHLCKLTPHSCEADPPFRAC